jgi:hypothetical protein
MASETEICNNALQLLGAGRITSISDSTDKKARECNVAYASTRDALLRRHPWSFAIRRAELAADATPPAFDYANAFTWPTEALRVLKPTNDPFIDWQMEGRKILTNYDAPLQIRYVAQVIDPNEMDALFREALAAKLAEVTCYAITQSNTRKAEAISVFDRVLAEARATNAIERIAGEVPEDSWVTVRL